jgi:hypothetical protein
VALARDGVDDLLGQEDLLGLAVDPDAAVLADLEPALDVLLEEVEHAAGLADDARHLHGRHLEDLAALELGEVAVLEGDLHLLLVVDEEDLAQDGVAALEVGRGLAEVDAPRHLGDVHGRQPGGADVDDPVARVGLGDDADDLVAGARLVAAAHGQDADLLALRLQEAGRDGHKAVADALRAGAGDRALVAHGVAGEDEVAVPVGGAVGALVPLGGVFLLGSVHCVSSWNVISFWGRQARSLVVTWPCVTELRRS